MRLIYICFLFLAFGEIQCFAQVDNLRVLTAAECSEDYIHLLKGKHVALVGNQTSTVGDVHLVDYLISKGVLLKKIFSPEHGFRGKADAGLKVNNSFDRKTRLPIYSLYGKNKKPSVRMMKNIDLVLFDIQDVGVRFYTYISTLHYVMEACAENNIPLIVLDRPNPNAFYIDGPVLKEKYKSFVGMHKVPVVYGMSIGEYACMINGEGWLSKGFKCDLKIIKMKRWKHETIYDLPVKPSPNLPNSTSILLYPSLCFFEGTIVSVGRGTDFPFQCYGHPDFDKLPITFIPRSIVGASKYPKLKSKLCRGESLRMDGGFDIVENSLMNLSYLIYAYNNIHHKHKFFTSFFTLLAGNKTLQKQIEKGMNEKQIRDSWQKDINDFKKIRAKYLLY